MLEEQEQITQNIAEAYSYWMFDIYSWAINVLGILPVSNNPKDYGTDKPARATKQQKKYLDAVSLLWKSKYYKMKGWNLTPAMQEAALKTGVSVKAGKGTGKNAEEAWVCIWAFDCWGHTNIKIYVTAPGMDQITQDIVWPEMNKWLDRQDENGKYYCDCRDKIIVQKEIIYVKSTAVMANGKEKIGAFMAAKVAPKNSNDMEAAKTLDGLHEDFMIIIVTEADGVREAVFTALETTLTKPMNICLLGFNPTRSMGFAKRTHTDPVESKDWIRQTQNAEESENVDKQSIEKKRARGINTNYYRIYVLGEFPIAEANTIIRWDWIMRAVENKFEEDEDYPLLMATDPGGGGADKTANVYRRKGKVTDIEEFYGVVGKDTTGEKCLTSLFQHQADDCIVLRNSVGADVFMHLAKYFKKVKGIYERNKVDELGPKGIKFYDLRAFLWYWMADAFENDLMDIPNDEELIEELSVSKWMDDTGNIKRVEEKKKIIRLLKRSPNKADALAATFAKGFDYAKTIGRKEKKIQKPFKLRESWMAA